VRDLFGISTILEVCDNGSERLASTRDPRQDVVDGQYVAQLFKTLKQSDVVGTCANALKTEVWTALIAMLMLKYLQLLSTFGWSLSTS